jgi:hypothetical protein
MHSGIHKSTDNRSHQLSPELATTDNNQPIGMDYITLRYTHYVFDKTEV